jgi:PPOX class probable F420-dependent enzyme
MLPNLDSENAARAEQRLGEETNVWLTTVRADGQPQTTPVGFVWDGKTFLIVTEPGSPKVRNLRGNPKVALHLDFEKDPKGGGVLTLEGVATVDFAPQGEPAQLSEDERAAYLDRHLDAIRSVGLTPAEAFAHYSAVIRVTPTRVRFY